MLCDIETIWLDRGYDSGVTRRLLRMLGLDDAVIAKMRNSGATVTTTKLPMGLRWPVERTNSWLSTVLRQSGESLLPNVVLFASILLVAGLMLAGVDQVVPILAAHNHEFAIATWPTSSA